MSSRAVFYATGVFQRGGVPLAQLPIRSAFGDAYGLSTAWIPGVRWTHSDLIERKANVSTYDHYDAIKALVDAGKSYNDIEAFPNYSAFTVIASNDSAALLKTAYWLTVGFYALNDTSLRDAALERLESGKTSGVDFNAANQNGLIKSTYDSAFVFLDKAIKRRGSTSDVALAALEQLRRGTDRKAVATRVEQATQVATDRQKVEDANRPAPATKNWIQVLFPSLALAEEAAEKIEMAGKIVGVLALGGLAYYGYRHYNQKNIMSNPLSDDYDPSAKKPMPRAADRQEQMLAKTVFKRVA
jgi:hypothetical protein